MPYVCVIDVLEDERIMCVLWMFYKTNALCVCCGCSSRRMPYVCVVDVLEHGGLMCELWMCYKTNALCPCYS